MLECPCGVDWKADKGGDQVTKEVNREVVYWTRYRNQGSELVGVMMMVLLEVVVQMVVMVEVDREAVKERRPNIFDQKLLTGISSQI